MKLQHDPIFIRKRRKRFVSKFPLNVTLFSVYNFNYFLYRNQLKNIEFDKKILHTFNEIKTEKKF